MHMVALYTVWYNFIRIHKSLRVTPAMAAGLSETVWDMDDLVRIMDERAPKPPARAVLTRNRFQSEALPADPVRGATLREAATAGRNPKPRRRTGAQGRTWVNIRAG